jgi:hypothetical protein
MQGKWVEEIGWRIPRIQVDGDIYLRTRPTHGCRADDDDDDDYDDDDDDDDDDYDDYDDDSLAKIITENG